jgi:uncharacterized protein (TIGR03083 family)
LVPVDAISERCGVLAEAWGWWATTLADLDGAAWERQTRLPAWDVAALVAHATLLVRALGYFAAHPVDGEPEVRTAVDMLRTFNQPGGVATTSAAPVAEMARQQAASMSHDELAAMFAVTAPKVIVAVEAAGPIVIDYIGNGTFPIGELMSVATMEAVVHALDLCAAVDVPASSIPAAPVQHTVGLLAGIAEPAAFIEAATGRRPVDVLPVVR